MKKSKVIPPVAGQKSKIWRILDVNINRTREGLRVIEDIVRFTLDNKRLTEKLKALRDDFKKTIRLIPQERLLKARQSGSDVGAQRYTPAEARRIDVKDIFLANVKRVEEALRVLEEFSKSIDPKLGRHFKTLRFKLYTIEKKIYLLLSTFDFRLSKLDFDLYVITDPGFGRSHLEIIKKAIVGGVRIVQLRDKTASKKDLLKWAKQIRKLTSKAGVTFIINDYVDIASAVNADGVHLGQEDLSVKDARNILGEDKIIGVSASNLKQAIKAEKDGADYIAVGPIFKTPLKSNTKPLGVRFIQAVKKRVKVPLVAIGGVNEANINKVGLKRIAVISAVTGSKDITSAVRKLRAKLQRLS